MMVQSYRILFLKCKFSDSKHNKNTDTINICGLGANCIQRCFTFCTVPGNTLMDAFIQKNYPGKYFNDNASIASKGRVNEKLLTALKDHSFFEQAFPKTTGPELFNLEYLLQAKKISETVSMASEDVLATLNRFLQILLPTLLKNVLMEKTFQLLCKWRRHAQSPADKTYLQKIIRFCIPEYKRIKYKP